MKQPSTACSMQSTLGDRTLRIQFDPNGDRRSHELWVDGPSDSILMLKSIEGDDQSIWPPSPPLQQLSIEPREAGDVALLVGMAGKSHWSLSVETLEDGGFRLEAACRMHASSSQDDARWVGSTYEILTPQAELALRWCASNAATADVHRDGEAWSVGARKPFESNLALWCYEIRLASMSPIERDGFAGKTLRFLGCEP